MLGKMLRFTDLPFLSLGILLILSPGIHGVEKEGDDPLQWLRNSIPGEPGVDYPIYSSAGDSAFSCDGLIFGGYYADPEYECQAYHVCLQDPVDYSTLYPVSFVCPNGTIFNQELFNCDWWYNVDCAAASGLYGLAEQAFGSVDGGAGDAGTCPAASQGSPDECAGAVSTCWSPGQRDTDCPGNGLCCFDGCADTCDGEPIAKPTNDRPATPEPEQPGYNYETPEEPLQPLQPLQPPRPTPRPQTTPRPTTQEPLGLYGPPARTGRQGRRFPSRNNRRQGRRVKNRKPVIFV